MNGAYFSVLTEKTQFKFENCVDTLGLQFEQKWKIIIHTHCLGMIILKDLQWWQFNILNYDHNNSKHPYGHFYGVIIIA